MSIAASVAIGSTMTSTLPPNPPPTVPPTKWSRLPGTCRMIEVLSRLKYSAWVFVYTVIRPFASGTAMQPVVSSGACSIGLVL